MSQNKLTQHLEKPNKTISEITNAIDLLYHHGWNERNGGNISYILSEDEVKALVGKIKVIKIFDYDFDFSPLVGKYFIVSATGSFFKNIKNDPETNLGILRVAKNGKSLELVWGYTSGEKPTSELPTHLFCHIVRLGIDPNHRLVIHSHPTNLIAMTHACKLDDNEFTRILWKMQTESIVVFPEGIGVLPWMLCGGPEIGKATCEKAKNYRVIVWAQHGLFATGVSIDEVYGLIETIEKAAEIYMKIRSYKILQSIDNSELKKLCKAFNVTYKKGVID